MEAYIGKCLDSLLIPELDQVEVLVVNDGSKDRSSEIAHSYADRYPYSIRVIDKPNGNYGSCINTALPQCKGRYVRILDADDTFDTNSFAKFVRALHNVKEDLIVTPFRMVGAEEEVIRYYDIPQLCYHEKDVIKTLKSAGTVIFRMHNITYLTSIFQKFKYVQTEGISYTDTEWNLIPLGYCKTIRALDIPVYRYLFGREGQTMSPEQQRKSRGHHFMILKSLTNKYIEFDELSPYKELLLKSLLSYYQKIYFTSIYNDMGDRELLMQHDKWLYSKHPLIFNLVGELSISKEISYKFIKKSRENDYIIHRDLPFWLRLLISFGSRTHIKI